MRIGNRVSMKCILAALPLFKRGQSKLCQTIKFLDREEPRGPRGSSINIVANIPE